MVFFVRAEGSKEYRAALVLKNSSFSGSAIQNMQMSLLDQPKISSSSVLNTFTSRSRILLPRIRREYHTCTMNA